MVKKSQEANQTRLDKTTQEQTSGEQSTKTAAAGQKTQGKAATEAVQAAAQTNVQTNETGATATVSSAQAQTVQTTTQAAQQSQNLPAYVVRQVGEQMVQMVRQQLSSLRLTLRPPELGQLNLELSVKDGVVRVTMLAETAAAKSALDSGLEQLKYVLAQQGLKTERLEVLVNPDAQQEQAQSQSGGQNNSRSGLAGGESESEASEVSNTEQDNATLAAYLASGGSSVNVFA